MISGDFVFIYPWVLWFLLLIPFLGLWFLLQQRQYWRDTLSFSQVSVLRYLRHAKHPILFQRFLPLCLLLALGVCIVGLAQPALKTKVATQNSYLVLALDISISMEATDLSPNRLEAAKTTAIDFVKSLPKGTQLGLEFFAGNTYLVSPPIEDHQLIIEYLKSLKQEDLRPGTAIGDALITAIDSLQRTILPQQPSPEDSKPARTPHGSIILLTDGESNLGISPLIATQEAQKQRISVYTIGMGEETGAYVRGGIFTHLDESTLQAIARQTGGSYYRARSLKDFQEIYTQIAQKTLSYKEKTVSLMPWCLGLALVLILLAFLWSTHFRRF